MTYRLTTTHADGSQTVTEHDDHDEALGVAKRALNMGATGAAIVRPQPRGYRARVLRIDTALGQQMQVAALERMGWTRDYAMAWAREEAERYREETGLTFRPEVEVLR